MCWRHRRDRLVLDIGDWWWRLRCRIGDAIEAWINKRMRGEP